MITKYEIEIDRNRHPFMVMDMTYPYENTKFSDAESVAKMLNQCLHLGTQAEEKMVMVALDNSMHSLGIFQVAHGQISSCYVQPREIFLRAVLAGASHIILAHNHPSGTVEPSDPDRAFCEKVAEAGEMMNIPIEDFLIVAADRCCSFRELGYMRGT